MVEEEEQLACEEWSGRRGSNPRPTAWEAVTLPLSYSRAGARLAILPELFRAESEAGLEVLLEFLHAEKNVLVRHKQSRQDNQGGWRIFPPLRFG